MAMNRRAIAIVLNNEKGETLFAKRSLKKRSFPGEWSLPSLDFRRSVEDTIQEIGRKKLGCEITPAKLLAQGTDDRPEYFLEMDLYEAKIISGEPRCVDDSYQELAWKEPEEQLTSMTVFGTCTGLYKKFLEK